MNVSYIKVTDKEKEYIVDKIKRSPSLAAWVDRLIQGEELPSQKLDFFNRMIDRECGLYKNLMN